MSRAEVNEYFKKTKSWGYHCCDFAFEHSDGKVGWSKNNGCHGFMAQPYNCVVDWPKLTTLVTSLWCHDHMKKNAEAYWRFITGPESPWIQIVEDCEVIYRDNGDMCAIRVRADHPAQLLVNFMIATRQPNEHSTFVVSFNEYLKEGFSGIEAMYLSNYALLQPRAEPALVSTTAHYPLNGSLSWKKFKERIPDITKKTTYKEDHQYLPCNSIWDHGKKKEMSSNWQVVSPEGRAAIVRYLGKRQAYSGSFEKLYTELKVYSNDKLPARKDLLENIKSNYKEIFCEA